MTTNQRITIRHYQHRKQHQAGAHQAAGQNRRNTSHWYRSNRIKDTQNPKSMTRNNSTPQSWNKTRQSHHVKASCSTWQKAPHQSMSHHWTTASTIPTGQHKHHQRRWYRYETYHNFHNQQKTNKQEGPAGDLTVQTAVHHVQQSKDTTADVLTLSETRDAHPRRTLGASFTSKNNSLTHHNLGSNGTTSTPAADLHEVIDSTSRRRQSTSVADDAHRLQQPTSHTHFARPSTPKADDGFCTSYNIPIDLPLPLKQQIIHCPTLLRLETTSTPLAAINLHEATEYSLRQYHDTCDQQHTVLIYPDGSLQNHKEDSSWAFAVIHHDGDKPHYHGYTTGTVTESIATPLQHDLFDSTKIELCAIIWSIIYCLQLPPSTPKEIHTDSESAIHFLVQFTHSEDPITRIAQALFSQASTSHNITIHHVPGHCYHPWNELADVLAKQHCDLSKKIFNNKSTKKQLLQRFI